MKSFICFLFFAFCQALSLASVPGYVITQSYYHDAENKTSFAALTDVEFSEFRGDLSLGFRQGVTWIRFDIKPLETEDKKLGASPNQALILQVGPYALDHLDLHEKVEGHWRVKRNGGPQANAANPCPAPLHCFALNTNRVASSTYFLKVQTQGLRRIETEILASEALALSVLPRISRLYAALAISVGLFAFGVFFFLFNQTRLLHIYCWHQLFIALFIYSNSGIFSQNFPDFSQGVVDVFGNIIQVLRVATTVLLGWAVLINFHPKKSYKIHISGLLLICILCIILIASGQTHAGLELNFLIFVLNPFIQIYGIHKTKSIPKKTKKILFLGYLIYIIVLIIGSVATFGPINSQLKEKLFHNFSDWHLNGIALSIFVLWFVLNEQVKKTQEKMLEIQTLRIESLQVKADHDLLNERSKLVDILTHELKTPLGTIRFAIASLKREIEQHGESINRIRHIEKSVNRMNELIDHVTSFVRIDQGGVKSSNEEVFISTLTTELIQEYADSEKFKLIIEDELPLMTVRQLLFLIIKNLIGNAQKYSSMGNIFISIKSNRSIKSSIGSFVYFEIRNLVDAHNQPDETQLFERYYRHPNVVGLPGLGIGLSLVKSAAKNIGATVHYESKEDWAIFTVKFPV